MDQNQTNSIAWNSQAQISNCMYTYQNVLAIIDFHNSDDIDFYCLTGFI